MRKKTVPIVSGNIKYLGMSVPEWTLGLSPLGFYLIVVPDEMLYMFYITHVIVLFIYIFFISKLEENILQIILTNIRIPNIVYGIFKRPTPINQLMTTQTTKIDHG